MVPGSGNDLRQLVGWANTPRGGRPIRVRDGFLQGACEVPVAFALAL